MVFGASASLLFTDGTDLEAECLFGPLLAVSQEDRKRASTAEAHASLSREDRGV